MQEFESISASSYDPSALATKLTAKAAEGWSVVAIVPTGGDVTAFVTRDKDGAKEETTETKAPEPVAATEAEEKKEEEDAAEEESPSLMLPAKADADAGAKPDSKPDEVSEPAGWAIAPEPATPSTPSAPSAPSAPTPSGPTIPTPERAGQPAVSVAPTDEPAPASVSPAAAAAAATTPAAVHAPEPAVAPAVPAGWYADPAGRFELRYWDGSTWTEHVSRAGQQFTDPPVA
jgi:Protein of unknown function (DUF2510)